MNVTPKINGQRLNEDRSKQLVELARTGCSDSLRQLVESHHQLIRLYLARYVRCLADVDDVAQEVFVVAFGQLDRFRGESKFSTWLTGIARNKALEFLRAEGRAKKTQHQLLQLEILNQQVSRLKSQQNDFELLEERLSAMQLCLNELPNRSRELIDKYYFDQQSSVSIAAELDEAPGALRMKLLRIRRILQKCILARCMSFDDE